MRSKISAAIAAAVEKAQQSGALPQTDAPLQIEERIRLEVPKDKEHGDFACNIAMMLAKPLRSNPRAIAEEIVSCIEPDSDIDKIEVAGAGFINFYLNSSWLYEVLNQVEVHGDVYKRQTSGQPKESNPNPPEKAQFRNLSAMHTGAEPNMPCIHSLN